MPPTPLVRRLAAPVALLLALSPLVACSGDPEPGGAGTPDVDPTGTASAGPGTTEGDDGQSPAPTSASPGRTGTPSPSPLHDGTPGRPRVVGTVASGLRVPWGLDFLPDGTALVTERDTRRVLAVTPKGQVRRVGRISEAAPAGEAGLLGLAVSPDFDDDRRVFLYYTTDRDNRVVSMRYDGRRLSDPRPVLTGIPRAFIHDGGRLAFGPDGFLYVATGEVGEADLAQQPDSLAGKILRITPQGDPAPGNPRRGSPVWSLGHRNVQGLAFDDAERLWASEFGASSWDELNLVEPGTNYGWPIVEGRGDRDDLRNPAVQWPTPDASPSGLAYADGALWMASLRGARLWRIAVTPDGAGEARDFLVGDYGRLRTVALAPDGSLWLTTSNHDGRGDPAGADDRILRVSLGG